VIDPDPVVQWNVTVEANSSTVVTYEISVPPDGADAARLDQWAKDLEAEQASALADAQAALEAAQTEAERAYAQALLDAARQSNRSFNPTPNAPGCKFCGAGGTTATSPPSTDPDPGTTFPTIPEDTTPTTPPTTP
jgi:type II secretory pathway pseudopilin PulG